LNLIVPDPLLVATPGSSSPSPVIPAIILVIPATIVIPAKAGIHPAVIAVRQNGSRLSPG
jgi:hypothetical protein